MSKMQMALKYSQCALVSIHPYLYSSSSCCIRNTSRVRDPDSSSSCCIRSTNRSTRDPRAAKGKYWNPNERTDEYFGRNDSFDWTKETFKYNNDNNELFASCNPLTVQMPELKITFSILSTKMPRKPRNNPHKHSRIWKTETCRGSHCIRQSTVVYITQSFYSILSLNPFKKNNTTRANISALTNFF